MFRFIMLITFFFLFLIPSYAQMDMDNHKMKELLNNIGEKLEGELGNWQILFEERVLFIITDEPHNRMRIFTPIIEQKHIKNEVLQEMLEANFHAALDAKYAIYGGYVVSLFTHPLKELTADQFKDAIRQVGLAADNFGTTYSSTDIIFGGNTEDTPSEKEQKINQKPKKKT